jgi:MFS family permease
MPDKTRSLRALDFLNFFNAGIQTGLGPFIAIYYATARHWNPGQVGILLSIQMLAGVLLNSYMGHQVDRSKHKRRLTMVAAVAVACGCMGILIPSFWVQCIVQAIIGVAITAFPAATSAFDGIGV